MNSLLFSLDQYLFELKDYLVTLWSMNKYTATYLLGLLIMLAKASPWKWDEKILDMVVKPVKALIDRLSSGS
ncbi:MAG: hypothetical protein ACXADW_23155 [Candidatus Hodarchaeales archaeon]|jgi:hypothetical protein